jgi:hypothetical protein
MLQDLRLCSDKIYYFLKHVKIIHPDKGIVPFRPYNFQKKMLSTVQKKRNVIILASRQSGKCVYPDTKIKIRNKKTQEVMELTMEEFYNMNKKSYPEIILMDKKFVDEVNISDYEVLTPDGWKDFNGIGKTIEYDVWHVQIGDKEIKCADNHIFITKDNEMYCKDINVNTYVQTIDGYEKVDFVYKTDEKSYMYDLLDVDGSIYYTNNVVSHNSTCISAYALWYAIFNDNKNIGIVSNKAVSAIDILSKIKLIYEEIPMYLKPGVHEYSKSFISFENGSRISVSATSPSAFRGKTLNLLICLGGENYVTVRDKTTGEIKNIKIEDLYEEL